MDNSYRMFVKYIPWIPHLRYILLKKTPSVLMHINCYKEYVQFKFKHYPFHILLHVVVCQYCTKILLGGEFKIHASPRSSDYVYMCIFVSTFIFLVSVHGYEVRRCFCYCCFFALFLHAFHIHLLPCKQYTIILSGVWVTLKTVVL